MSRTSKRTGSSSPVKKYLEFKGGSGTISFYDKDKEERVELESLKIILVDDLASVSGFNEAESSGYNSNLLNPYDTGKIPFTVKSRVNGQFTTVEEGIWKEIKNSPKLSGAKYTRNLFAIADVGYGYELVRLELNGSGLRPWLDLVDSDSQEIYNKVITITKGQLYTRKSGENVPFTDKEIKALEEKLKKNPMAQRPVLFYSPNITLGEVVGEDLVTLAEEADVKLQEYLNIETEDSPAEVLVESPTVTAPTAPDLGEEDDDLPF